jgi:hypothetical protein
MKLSVPRGQKRTCGSPSDHRRRRLAEETKHDERAHFTDTHRDEVTKRSKVTCSLRPSTMSHWKQYSYDAISAVFLVLALDLIIANHAATLEPIYGSAPTWLHFWNIFRVAALAAMSTPSTVALKIAEYFHIVGSVLFAMPLLSHLLAVHTSRFGNPLWGPVVVHAAILLPISYAFIVTATIHVSLVCPR